MMFITGGAKDEHKRVNSGFGTQRTRAAQVLNHHLIITSSPPPHHHPCHCFHILFFFMVIHYISITTIQLLESPIPTPTTPTPSPTMSQKGSSGDISGTKRGTIDPLVSKRPEKYSE